VAQQDQMLMDALRAQVLGLQPTAEGVLNEIEGVGGYIEFLRDLWAE